MTPGTQILGSDPFAIQRMIDRTKQIERLTMRSIVALFAVALFGAMLIAGRPVVAVFGTLLTGAVGVLVARLVFVIIVGPWWAHRYASVARELSDTLACFATAGAVRHHWSDPVPGAVAIVRTGHVLIADQSTGFSIHHLPCDRIVGTQTTSTAECAHESHRSGGMFDGWLGRIVGLTRLRYQTQKSQNPRRHGLAIHYRLAPEAAVATCCVGFGDNETEAVFFKSILDRLIMDDPSLVRTRQ